MNKVNIKRKFLSSLKGGHFNMAIAVCLVLGATAVMFYSGNLFLELASIPFIAVGALLCVFNPFKPLKK